MKKHKGNDFPVKPLVPISRVAPLAVVSPDRLLSLKVDLTIVGGKVLYNRTQNHA